MFGLLNTTQIYGIQSQSQEHEQHFQISFHPMSPPASATASSSTTSSSAQQNIIAHSNSNHHPAKGHQRTSSSVSDSGGGSGGGGGNGTSGKFLSNLTSKSPTNFLEKFLRSDLLNTYDSLKNYRNSFPSNNSQNKRYSDPLNNGHVHHHPEGFVNSFNCLHGSYRHSFDGEFYEKTDIKHNLKAQQEKEKQEEAELVASSLRHCSQKSSEMTIKCSKNLLAVEPEVQGPATLQNYQKIPESEHDLLVDSLLVASSGASSGEFNSSSDTTTQSSSGGGGGSAGGSSSFSSSSSNLYKRLSFGGIRNSQNSQKQEKNAQAQQQQQQMDGVTDNSSITLNLTSSMIPNLKVIDLHRSSSSNSSSGDCASKRERKKGAMTPQPQKTPLSQLLSLTSSNSSPQPSSQTGSSSAVTSPSPPPTTTTTTISPHDKAQRRKLLQMLAHYDQQNKLLQRELAKEKRRRSEELACVVKSLLCFESKLKTDMKSVNQRLQDKDVEICRLVRQNRALRQKVGKLQECTRDEGVVEDGEGDENETDAKDLLEDCLVLEALQCINCRRQFYDIEVQESCTQTTLTGAGTGGNCGGNLKDSISGSRNNDDPTTEHGSSSDDTVSSSFFGARRSVRYTSKRTSGTFRDYMRSRAMNIDDPSLEADNNSEEYPSTLSRDDSRENIYSRTIERMHGVKCESERDSEQSGLETSSSSVTRSNSRASTKSSKSSSSKASEMSNPMEEDDGIFSPTQDEDFEEDDNVNCRNLINAQEEGKLKIVRGRALEAFSEASPKQIYETSTDDWYASASDQEEITGGTVTSKSYGQGAVNPVLECVNQILLQQSMEGIEDRSQTPKNSNSTTLPRRSSLSDRRNNRSNSRASDGAAPNSRNGTLIRKRVHFSTKNSMVHVPRNDETEEEEEDGDGDGDLKPSGNMISNYQLALSSSSYISHSPHLDKVGETERLEIFNYESIYSNEYEPIGSERNSNLYVDMDSNSNNNAKSSELVSGGGSGGKAKLPPALPPKPANLLKFKKSLQQLDESPDEMLESHGEGEILVEPDYCSISEVNVGITSVQIRADIHRAPLSDRDLESVQENDNDLDAATVVSEANSQKTEEIEEIFADIPKLPNVAAIIAPKSVLKQNEYLVMTPKNSENKKVQLGIMALNPASTGGKTNVSPNGSATILGSCKKTDRSALKLNLTSPNQGSFLNSTLKSPKMENSPPATNMLRPQLSSANYQQQYKRKHMPNILQEINKRLSLPNSPITPTPPINKNSNNPFGKSSSSTSSASTSAMETGESLHSLPLQAEFDWYNLDAEYGKNSQTLEHGSKVSEVLGNGIMSNSLLADIKEDGESLINNADEYNLDEEYSDEMEESERELEKQSSPAAEAINPVITHHHHHHATKAKKIKKNLANFEKFIENSNIHHSKPLPTKRKIYFAGPFV